LEGEQDPVPISLEGRAVIQGKPVVRQALPADDMMQAFAYRHLVLAQDLLVTVSGRFRVREGMSVVTPAPLRLTPGGTVRLKLQLPVGDKIKEVAFELLDPPEGISIKETKGMELVLQADTEKVKPGQKGNLIIKAMGEPTWGGDKEKPAMNKFKISLGTFPAVPYEVIQ
jgi:hypothetical protein